MRPTDLRVLFLLSGALCGAGFFSGCGNACSPGRGGKALVVMAYNVHNLFDAEDSGSEYPEYSVEAGTWDEARFGARLKDLARVVLAAEPAWRGPDILCLEEVEGLPVLEALRQGPLASSGYGPAVLVPAPGQAVNCGLLARYPVTRVLAHGLVTGKARPYEASGASPGPGSGEPRQAGRYLLEVGLEVEGRPLTVFVCHWKSKLGGAEVTEAERREDAAVLAGRVAELLAREPGAAILACGDFNESPDEYVRVDRAYPTALMPVALTEGRAVTDAILVAEDPRSAGLSESGSPVLYSPWARSEGWSYLSKGSGERIDGFLLSPGLLGDAGEGGDAARTGASPEAAWCLLSFEAFAPAFLLDSGGKPVAYDPKTARGFSDHLPVILRLGTP